MRSEFSHLQEQGPSLVETFVASIINITSPGAGSVYWNSLLDMTSLRTESEFISWSQLVVHAYCTVLLYKYLLNERSEEVASWSLAQAMRRGVSMWEGQ